MTGYKTGFVKSVQKMRQMLKPYFCIDMHRIKDYDCIKITGYLTGNVIGFTRIVSEEEVKG